MFTGEHERTLDEKGRLVIPPNYRPHLADGCYWSRSTEQPCVLLYTQSEILETAQRLNAAVRDAKASGNDLRRWSASVTEAKLDAQGRVQVPAKLRQVLGMGQHVKLIGVINRAEVWDADEWSRVESEQDGDSPEAIWM